MFLFKKAKDIAEGIGRQVNPFDNGATFSNRTPQRTTNMANLATAAKAAVTGARNQINPFDGGKTWANPTGRVAPNLVENADKSYAFTPEFKARVLSENPMLVNQTGFNPGDEANAGGLYRGNSPRGQSNIQVRNGAGADTLAHEGLHSAWANGADQSRFRGLMNNLPSGSDIAPEQKYQYSPRDFAAVRYANYNGQAGGSFDDPNTLNELHSALPEFYFQKNRPLPAPLKSYYSQYFDPDKAHRKQMARNTVNDMIGLEDYYAGKGKWDR